MNEQTKITTMYEALPVVAELNRVPNFDPLKFAQHVPAPGMKGTRPKLDLKYKKLWLRLKYPQARLKITALKITDQIAIFEAKVFFDRKDTEPVASHVAACAKEDAPGGLYIERAEYEAKDQALDEAGFGIQLINASAETEKSSVAVQQTAVAEKAVLQPVNKVEAVAPAVEKGTETEEKESPVEFEQPVSMHNEQRKEPEKPQLEETEVISQQEEAVFATTAEVGNENMPADITAEPVSTQVEEGQPMQMLYPEAVNAPIAEETEAVQDQRYSAGMSVDEICAMMTLKEALEVTSDVGSCKGWTLEQVRDRRPASLKWYVSKYAGENNVLRAGAKLILESMEMAMAS